MQQDPLSRAVSDAERTLDTESLREMGERAAEEIGNYSYLAQGIEDLIERNSERVASLGKAIRILQTNHPEELDAALQANPKFDGYVDRDGYAATKSDPAGRVVLFSASRDHWGGSVVNGCWNGNYRSISPVTTTATIGASSGLQISIEREFMGNPEGNQIADGKPTKELLDELLLLVGQGAIDPYDRDDFPKVTPVKSEEVLATLQRNLDALYESALELIQRHYKQA